MKNTLILLLTVIGFQFLLSQETAISHLNSNNVLDYYNRLEKAEKAAGASTNLEQYGNNNYIEIASVSLSNLQVIQSGNQNTTLVTSTNIYPTNAEIRINGSNNHIDIIGSNSISDGMKMNINANSMTLLMRNY